MTIWSIVGFLVGLLFAIVLIVLIIGVIAVGFTLIVFGICSLKDSLEGGA